MLKLQEIVKTYTVGEFQQTALNSVSLEFRKSEFVTILGPSGCGKTTMLNIVGGLDHYDSGDLIISGKSTKNFVDAEWDAYRNNSIGFIFQSHNLISHLSILQNVEMGMALSGVSASERTARAKEVLIEVGLKDHIHKRPNQLSGGQSQRVAIARAIANNPDVILADEPTGSLDSVTSIQILELIKRVGTGKLVIMVTHNPEFAEAYSNRIIRLKDGVVVDDTNPVKHISEMDTQYQLKKTAMSFKTAVISSINNIRTKLGRTLLTAIAGSIGIIGIALILALSNGLGNEIARFEQETLAGYPIAITPSRLDFERLRELGETDLPQFPTEPFARVFDQQRFQNYLSVPNVITQDYIDYVQNYVNTTGQSTIAGVKFVRNTNMTVLVNTGTELDPTYRTFYSEVKNPPIPSNPGAPFSTARFTLLPEGVVFTNNYEVIYGSLPQRNTTGGSTFEVTLVVDQYNRIYKTTLERMGFVIPDDEINTFTVPFEDILGLEVRLFVGAYVSGESDVSSAITLRISGIVRAKETSNVTIFNNGLGYHHDLIDYIAQTYSSEIGSINSIFIYPNNFQDKEAVKAHLNLYNVGLDDAQKIEYVDQAQTFTSLVKGVIDTISIVLIGFAGISLVVSSIMIAIITYISVIERTKEIGVLRALGARKKDISRVFNTENLLIGFAAGTVGLLISLLLIIPINHIIYSLAEIPNVASLTIIHMSLLLTVSITLAFIAGLIPARMAAKKDPVVALRTE
jgi:putative ABC transport system permease protein